MNAWPHLVAPAKRYRRMSEIGGIYMYSLAVGDSVRIHKNNGWWWCSLACRNKWKPMRTHFFLCFLFYFHSCRRWNIIIGKGEMYEKKCIQIYAWHKCWHHVEAVCSTVCIVAGPWGGLSELEMVLQCALSFLFTVCIWTLPSANLQCDACRMPSTAFYA